MLEFEDTDLYELGLPGDIYIPRILMTLGGLPDIQIRVGDRHYEYERSFPIKGHGTGMTPYIREHLEAGRKPLVIERPERFYIYLEKPAPAAPAEVISQPIATAAPPVPAAAEPEPAAAPEAAEAPAEPAATTAAPEEAAAEPPAPTDAEATPEAEAAVTAEAAAKPEENSGAEPASE